MPARSHLPCLFLTLCHGSPSIFSHACSSAPPCFLLSSVGGLLWLWGSLGRSLARPEAARAVSGLAGLVLEELELELKLGGSGGDGRLCGFPCTPSEPHIADHPCALQPHCMVSPMCPLSHKPLQPEASSGSASALGPNGKKKTPHLGFE